MSRIGRNESARKKGGNGKGRAEEGGRRWTGEKKEGEGEKEITNLLLKSQIIRPFIGRERSIKSLTGGMKRGRRE